MARYERPLTRKQYPVPAKRVTKPPSAMPNTRDEVITPVLIDIAFGSADFGTRSPTMALRTGVSNALARPEIAATTSTAGRVARSVKSNTASDSAERPSSVWVTTITRRLSTRSDSAPAQAPSTSIGVNWKIDSRPSSCPPPWSWLTISHDIAIDCIHVPTIESVRPAKYRFAPG